MEGDGEESEDNVSSEKETDTELDTDGIAFSFRCHHFEISNLAAIARSCSK